MADAICLVRGVADALTDDTDKTDTTKKMAELVAYRSN